MMQSKLFDERKEETKKEKQVNKIHLFCGDCLEIMRGMPANSVDLIATDPPYYRVKDEPWDRQWNNKQKFLAWMDTLAEQWQRILKPNGSLYVFASPKMSTQIECKIGERFNVLNKIRWVKKGSTAMRNKKETLRSFLSLWEEIIFAEHHNADSIAKFVFEPIRDYLNGERQRAGISSADCLAVCGDIARHYFSRNQWQLPTAKHYTSLQELFNTKGRSPAPPYEQFHNTPRSSFEQKFNADYNYLRADYENLRATYMNLRRPFSVTVDVPYTDVWGFSPVAYYPGDTRAKNPWN